MFRLIPRAGLKYEAVRSITTIAMKKGIMPTRMNQEARLKRRKSRPFELLIFSLAPSLLEHPKLPIASPIPRFFHLLSVSTVHFSTILSGVTSKTVNPFIVGRIRYGSAQRTAATDSPKISEPRSISCASISPIVHQDSLRLFFICVFPNNYCFR